MARSTAASASDGESEVELTRPNVSKSRSPAPDDKQDQGGEDSDEEEEYEIEEILDAKRGTFPGGRLGYLVKWKGYDQDQNSWVDERDIGNARDLVHAFWTKTKKESKGRKSAVSRPRASTGSASVKSRKASVPQDEDSDVEEIHVPAKKRSRPPTAKVSIVSDSDEVEEMRREIKRFEPTSSARKQQQHSVSEAMDIDEDEQYENTISAEKWADVPSWEKLVDKIVTVERRRDGQLYVYFRMKNNKGLCMEPSKTCRKKMPQKMLAFYEDNLRWRNLDQA